MSKSHRIVLPADGGRNLTRRALYSKAVWHTLPKPVRFAIGALGSAITLLAAWAALLEPLGWPQPQVVAHYLGVSISSQDTYLAFLMTGLRALISMVLGFGLALTFAVLTGRTVLGWIAFFFLLLMLQKIPAIAMVHVLVSSKLGIGLGMTTVLASTVVLTYTWLVLHHRAETLDPRDVFALRVVGFRGVRLALYGLLPHLGSAIGSSARLAMSIAVVMVVLGEWQGVWSDGSVWQYGLGVQISRSYDSIDSEARVLAACAWLGLLGVVLDVLTRAGLRFLRRVTGVDLSR